MTMLLFTLAPPVAALGEWLVSGKELGRLAILGMFIAMTGVVLVITNKKEKNSNSAFTLTKTGLLLGAGAAFCQGAGLVLSKMGLETIDPLSGTFIRMVTAVPIFAVIYFIMGGRLSKVLKERRGIAFAFIGAFFGPFLGVTLSLVAVKHCHSGVAMTILSTTPITVLPFSVLVYKERLTIRTVVGACIAVAGVSLLFI